MFSGETSSAFGVSGPAQPTPTTTGLSWWWPRARSSCDWIITSSVAYSELALRSWSTGACSRSISSPCIVISPTAIFVAADVDDEGDVAGWTPSAQPTRRAVSTRLISYSTRSSASAPTIPEKRCGCSGVMQLASGLSSVHGVGWQNWTTL